MAQHRVIRLPYGLIGCSLADEADAATLTLLFFAVAIAVHFVVNDFGLREHHRDACTRLGRLGTCRRRIVGRLLSQLVELPERALVAVLAFLAGGVILNVLKEELPERRRSRFRVFAVRAGGYAALLQAV